MSEELVALEEALADSIRRSDAVAAERLLAADYALSSTGGVSPQMTRADWVATLLSGTYAISDVFRREDGDWRLAWRISVRLADE